MRHDNVVVPIFTKHVLLGESQGT